MNPKSLKPKPLSVCTFLSLSHDDASDFRSSVYILYIYEYGNVYCANVCVCVCYTGTYSDATYTLNPTLQASKKQKAAQRRRVRSSQPRLGLVKPLVINLGREAI